MELQTLLEALYFEIKFWVYHASFREMQYVSLDYKIKKEHMEYFFSLYFQ